MFVSGVQDHHPSFPVARAEATHYYSLACSEFRAATMSAVTAVTKRSMQLGEVSKEDMYN